MSESNNQYSIELWDDDVNYKSMVETKKTGFAEIAQRFNSDPLVFLFSGLSVTALVLGMRSSFIKHDSTKSLRYMYMRLGFHGLATGAVCYSLYKTNESFKRAYKKYITDKIG